jgi:flagellar hook-associated protein 3 FlgL
VSTRITTGMLSARVLGDLNRVSERLTKTQSKIASGKEIERPSDDPFGVSRAMVLRENLDGVRQYERNVEDARGWQDAAESALDRVTDVVQRARELLVQGAGDTMDKTARASIAREIEELTASVKEFGNASYKGQYLFGGIRTDAPPWPASTDVYQGQAGTVARQIGPGVSVQVNVDIAGVLGDGQASGDGGLLHVLRDITSHLRADDGEALRGSDLTRLDDKLEQILDVRALNGARSNRLESALGRLGELEEASISQLSETEDVDIAKAMIDFSSQQAAYQAALKAGANIVQSSLMDFLR